MNAIVFPSGSVTVEICTPLLASTISSDATPRPPISAPMCLQVVDGEIEQASARALRVAEHLHPRAGKHLPFDERGHRIVVGGPPEQRRVPLLTSVDVGYGHHRQYMFYRHVSYDRIRPVNSSHAPFRV
jgi:hypothetical protein